MKKEKVDGMSTIEEVLPRGVHLGGENEKSANSSQDAQHTPQKKERKQKYQRLATNRSALT